MTLLGIDVGSSSVKATVLHGGRVAGRGGRVVRCFYKTDHDGVRAEVPGERVLRALSAAVGELGASARRVDAVALSVMSPAWVAMDARGRALTPIVTHQDRRSVELAREIERRVGKSRHLRLAGNRPFPGSIASTTWAWYLRHEPDRIAKADLVGLLNTYLHRQLTGARVIDPSNASFTGLYSTLNQSGWSDELCGAIGAKRSQLPEIHEADAAVGTITTSAARRFALTHGTPVLTGLIDTSAAMLLAGPRPGRLLNVCGSTDVLALCTDRPRPHERLLTRALGLGKRWMSVSTIAAAGSSLLWARQQLFPDLSTEAFRALTHRLAKLGSRGLDGVRFEPYLAGERSSMDQRRGAFSVLTLSTTREQLLQAMIDALARASAERLTLLRAANRVRFLAKVSVSGGGEDRLDRIFQRDWPGRWIVRRETEASLRGLACLVPRDA